MNLNLNYEGFETNLISEEPSFGGVQYRFKFDNGYGASVIKHKYSYGSEDDLWELAVLDSFDVGPKGMLTYDTPITEDVEGYLTDEEVRNLLAQIKEL